MGLKTPLYNQHVGLGAKIVDFGGWDMPLHYGSQLEEHHAVRDAVGVFDVSHMMIVDIKGADAKPFLRRLLANDVAKLSVSGKALYSCMLNEHGGVVDDLIAYYLNDEYYRVVCNAGTREQDLAWITKQASGFDVTIEEQADLAMVAVQGPAACEVAASLLDAATREQALSLKPFHALDAAGFFIARTGYTGEDGFEIAMPASGIGGFWERLVAAGVRPCGLGARDTLRLEAGMNLYGTDMDQDTSPLAAGLAWTIAWEPADRHFVGREALEQQKAAGPAPRFCGLLLEGRGVLRNHLRVVVEGLADGEISSGGFSPTLNRSIALARLPAGDYDRAQVDVRGKLLDVRIVKPPFVRNGKAVIEL